MQQRVIYPDKDKWTELGITEEEKIVYNRFNADDFPSEWEMYIHPHLNGLRPALVLLHPKIGIAVYEFISESNLSTIKESFEKDLTIHNPLKKVELYEREIVELYCPRLGAKYGTQYNSAITVGLIFTNILQTKIKGLIDDYVESLKSGDILSGVPKTEIDGLVNRLEKYTRYYPIVGLDSLSNLNILFPNREPNYSSFPMMDAAQIITDSKPEDTAADLRAWLTETGDWSTVLLNESQREIATTNTSTGYRWVDGPAGSGRSVALTARAVELDRNGKNVLICTFNITLVNYLHYLVARHVLKQEYYKRNIDIFYFHDWCKRVCRSSGREGEYNKLWGKVKETEESMDETVVDQEKDKVLDELLPELVQGVFNNPSVDAMRLQYDAILVDEGQDFQLSWWQTLQKALKPDGEMLLVADKTQDIYENKNWLDEPKPGFHNWKGLKTNYRLPHKLTKVLKDYADRFLPIDVDIPKHGVLDLYPVELRWVQKVSNIPSVDVCFKEALRQRTLLEEKGNHEFSDITFLSAYKNIGKQFVGKCKEKHIGVRDTYGISYDGRKSYYESRCKKRLFFSRDSRMKSTTLHSFKGLESRHLVVYVDRIDSPNTRALLYVGLTRLKVHPKGSRLTVVSSCPDPELRDFGYQNFSPNYEEC